MMKDSARYLKVLRVITGWLVFGAWFFTGCSESFQNQPVPFQVPTSSGYAFVFVQTETPTPTIAVTQRPAATLACTDNLKYLNDITIMDGSIVQPRQPLDKRWLVENNGSCNWDSRYRLKLVDGSSMGAPEEQALYPARSGLQAEIRMNFIAPDQPGVVYSAWQAYNPEGQAFGDPFFIEIIVESP